MEELLKKLWKTALKLGLQAGMAFITAADAAARAVTGKGGVRGA